jgi:hypothetical protein
VALSSLDSLVLPAVAHPIWLNHRDFGASSLSGASECRLRRKLRIEAPTRWRKLPCTAAACNASGTGASIYLLSVAGAALKRLRTRHLFAKSGETLGR